MFLSRTPNSPLNTSSEPFSLFLQKVHPLWLPFLPLRLNHIYVATKPISTAPPILATTAATITLGGVRESEVGEGVGEEVTIDVWVTTTVLPPCTDSNVVKTMLLELCVDEEKVHGGSVYGSSEDVLNCVVSIEVEELNDNEDELNSSEVEAVLEALEKSEDSLANVGLKIINGTVDKVEGTLDSEF